MFLIVYEKVDKYGLYLSSHVPTRGSFINAIVASVSSTEGQKFRLALHIYKGSDVYWTNIHISIQYI